MIRKNLEILEQLNIDYFEELQVELVMEDRVSFITIAIPGGTFVMGSPEGEGEDNERLARSQTIELSSVVVGRLDRNGIDIWFSWQGLIDLKKKSRPGRTGLASHQFWSAISFRGLGQLSDRGESKKGIKKLLGVLPRFDPKSFLAHYSSHTTLLWNVFLGARVER